jgi:hypothetical protein
LNTSEVDCRIVKNAMCFWELHTKVPLFLLLSLLEAMPRWLILGTSTIESVGAALIDDEDEGRQSIPGSYRQESLIPLKKKMMGNDQLAHRRLFGGE